MTPKEIAVAAVRALASKKAKDVRMIGIRDLTILADYFVIATGTSNTHVKALADEVEFALKQQGVAPNHEEGHHSNTWILLDYGSVVVHVFQGQTREFYDIERLWKDGEAVDLSSLLEEAEQE